MAEDWSVEEVHATVADYFDMLTRELRGERYNKAEHNRRLQGSLRERSTQAIEFKHANISAVLIELGYPYIEGYKPRANYQLLLMEVVASGLSADERLTSATKLAVGATATIPDLVRPISDIIVPAPIRSAGGRQSYEGRVVQTAPRIGVNYLEQESRNASLGAAGEAFVLDFEHRRLWESGRRDLANRVDHVSQTLGDGLGYDIASFDESGRERLIEVKTTGFGSRTPFFASRREVSVSEERALEYALYRVFKFRECPQIFMLSGSLRLSCTLDPTQFKASVT